MVVLSGSGLAWWASRPRVELSVPRKLDLVAGGAPAMLFVALEYGPFARRSGLVDSSHSAPPEVKLERIEGTGFQGLVYRVGVADPNARPGPRRLSLRVDCGGPVLPADIELDVREPEVSLPDGRAKVGGRPGPAISRRAKGSGLARIGDKVYPKRIERVLPDGTAVPLLLIEGREASGPPSFYLMEDKVWNELFAKFAPKHPSAGKERLPVMEITARQAHEFAVWLGGSLPSPEQWDKAAGYYDRGDRVGPYLDLGDKKGGVAVNRGEPKEVGGSVADVSPFGCRDMSGNGQEFTRGLLDSLDQLEEALARPASDPGLVVVRGQPFFEDAPLTYKEIADHRSSPKTLFINMKKNYVGFRVAIEIAPGPPPAR